MLEIADRPSNEALDATVAGVLATLYAGLAGSEPLSVRAYRDDDAILVLLRFDPLAPQIGRDPAPDPLMEVSMLAMPDLIVAAVLERTGERLLPGSLSVSVERGLAVFGFSVLDQDAPLVVEMFGLDGGIRLAG